MRGALLLFGLILGISPFVCAQDSTSAKRLSPTQQQHAILASVIDTKDFEEELTLTQFLAAVTRVAKKSEKSPLRLAFNFNRFRGENPEQFGADIKIGLKDLRPQMTVRQLLEQGLASVNTEAVIVVREGLVEILPPGSGHRADLYNRKVDLNFANEPLDQAVEALADYAGVSVVLDPRIKEKAKTLVSARFRGDVGMQDALRILVESAELKLIHLTSGLFVTTNSHADRMRNELAAIYSIPLRVREAAKAAVGDLGCAPQFYPFPLTPPHRFE